MPRPRFDKLAEEKRERILEAAAKEFAARGYDGASMNRILDGNISKGQQNRRQQVFGSRSVLWKIPTGLPDKRVLALVL